MNNEIIIISVLVAIYLGFKFWANSGGNRSADIGAGKVPMNPPSGGGTVTPPVNTGGGGAGSSVQINTPVTTQYDVDFTVKAEPTNNTLDLSSFYKPNRKKTLIADASLAWPIYRGEKDLLSVIQAGFSHAFASNYYAAPELPLQNTSKFFTEPISAGGVITAMANRLLSTEPKLQWVLDQNWTAINNDPSLITFIGNQLAADCLMVKDVKDGQYKWANMAFFNQEINGGQAQKEVGFKICNHIANSRPETVILNYGSQPNSLWWGGLHWYDSPTAAAVEAAKNENLFGFAGVKNGKMYFDGQPAYVKAPLPVSSNIFERDSNGKVVLEGGKKKLRRDQFSEHQFGIKNTWFNQPTGNIYEGSKSVRDSQGRYVTDLVYSLVTPYRFVQAYKVVMAQLAKMNGHGSNYQVWRDYPNLPIAVQSQLSEHSTYGQNTIYRRWLGEQQIKFNVMAAIFSGYAGVSFWESGFLSNVFRNPDYTHSTGNYTLPKQGEKMFPQWGFEGTDWKSGQFDENMSRHKWAAAAVAMAQDIMSKYTRNETLKFIDFTDLVNGYKKREIIMLGVYQGGNCDLVISYPFHEPNSETIIELDFPNRKIAVKLKGGETKLISITSSYTGKNPVDFKARYYNIDGELIQVTGDQSNHNF